MKKILLLLSLMVIPFINCHSQEIQKDFKTGYKAILEVGYGKCTDYDIDKFQFLTSHGVNITPNMFVGAGFGVEYYSESESTVIPVYLDMRSKLFNKNFAPTIGMKVGYSFNDLKGWYICPNIGYQINQFMVSVGYTLQYVRNDWADLNCNCLSFKIGYAF
jgi:hypothetical protein